MPGLAGFHGRDTMQGSTALVLSEATIFRLTKTTRESIQNVCALGFGDMEACGYGVSAAIRCSADVIFCQPSIRASARPCLLQDSKNFVDCAQLMHPVFSVQG